MLLNPQKSFQEKISIPKQKEYDDKFNELTRGLSDIKTLVASLPAENVNLSPLMTRLNELSQELKTKPVTKETDLKPMIKLLQDKMEDNKDDREINRKEMKDILSSLESNLSDVMEKKLPEAMKEITFTVPPVKMSSQNIEKKEEAPFNIKNLAK